MNGASKQAQNRIASLERRLAVLREGRRALKQQCFAQLQQLRLIDEQASAGRYCGCYVLLEDAQPLYVGQSINVFARIASHRSALSWPTKGRFDEVRIVWCDAGQLNDTEAALIAQLRPVGNTAGRTTHYMRRRVPEHTPAAVFGPGFSDAHVGVAT